MWDSNFKLNLPQPKKLWFVKNLIKYEEIYFNTSGLTCPTANACTQQRKWLVGMEFIMKSNPKFWQTWKNALKK